MSGENRIDMAKALDTKKTIEGIERNINARTNSGQSFKVQMKARVEGADADTPLLGLEPDPALDMSVETYNNVPFRFGKLIEGCTSLPMNDVTLQAYERYIGAMSALANGLVEEFRGQDLDHKAIAIVNHRIEVTHKAHVEAWMKTDPAWQMEDGGGFFLRLPSVNWEQVLKAGNLAINLDTRLYNAIQMISVNNALCNENGEKGITLNVQLFQAKPL